MEKRREQNYTEEELKRAIADVKKGKSVRSVAKQYKIAKTTLQRKLKGGVKLATKKGPSPLFTNDQESNIVSWIKSMAKSGFPVTKETLMYSIVKLAKDYKITFPGENSLPGRKWYESFLRRHPDVKMRTSQNLTTSRQKVSQERINNWFEEVGTYLKNKKLDDVLCNPQRVFNCDETAFFLNPKPGKVLAEKGSKKVYTVAGADEKLNLTILLTANAAGELAPPMIVYRYARIPQHIAEAMPADWAIGKSENGWMTQETFYEYVTNIFEPYLNKHCIEKPVVLFMDGHTSHISLNLSIFCSAHGIEMVALPSNSTHLMQPMDVAVFHTLKSGWRQEVVNFRITHEGKQLQKHDFPQVLKSALGRLTPATIVNGFKACGLVPWDPKKVTVESTLTSKKVIISPIKEREMASFLEVLEDKIGEEKIKSFLENKGKWKGPVEQTDLYYLWLETKETLNMEPISQGTPVISVEAAYAEESIDTTYTDAIEQEQRSIVEDAEVELYIQGGSPENGGLSGPSNSAASKNVPSPFKRIIFWPEGGDKRQKKRKREKLPAVVTSPQMLQYYKKRESLKNAKDAEKEKRKTEREKRKIQKEELKKIADGKKRRVRKLSPKFDASLSLEVST